MSVFSLLKYYSVIDEKEQFNLYCLAEDKGLHNLLVSDKIFEKKTLSIALTLLLKVST